MKTVTLAAGLTLAATAAQAKTITLYGDHAVCSRIEVLAQLVDVSIGRAEWENRLNAEQAQGRCVVLPKGTRVTLDRQVGMFSCIRPAGLNICGWAVLNPKQLR